MRTYDVYSVLLPAKIGNEEKSNVIVHVCLTQYCAVKYFNDDLRDSDLQQIGKLIYMRGSFEHHYVSLDGLAKYQGCYVNDFIIEI